MKIQDVRSVIDIIRDVSKADIIIMSLFLLPILLGSWSVLLNSITTLDQYDDCQLAILIVISSIYVIGIVVVKCWDPPEEKLKRAKLHVKNRLERRQGNRASFMAIREEVNEEYTDDFLTKLIDKNPETFRTVRVKRHGNSIPGITLAEFEVVDS